MPGRPVQRDMEARLESLGVAEGLTGEAPFESPGEEWVFTRRAEGLSWGKVASLIEADGTQCSRQLVAYQWRRNAKHKERREELSRIADKFAAESHAEESGDVLDDLADRAEAGHMLTAPEVTLAKARSGHRQWLAEMKDPDRYGKRPDVEVNVSVGELHLDAIRRRRVDVGERSPALDVVETPRAIEAGS